MQVISLKNSYNLGDLIASLPGFMEYCRKHGCLLRIYQRIGLHAFYYQGAEHPIKDDSGNQVCMNMATFELVKPLLEVQKYIDSYNVWNGEETDFDLDKSRDQRQIPLPYGNIHFWPWFVYPELACDLSPSWIEPYYDMYGLRNDLIKQYGDKVFINRTSRYQNPYIHYFFLKKYQDRVMFIGLKDEHKAFCEKWGLKIKRLDIGNFLDVANVLHISRGFIGNQSFMWHVADAMKIPRVLEYCNVYPNTHPTGANGYAALYQEGLELYVEKLFE